MFENDVKIYGIQTVFACASNMVQFENDVKIYGIQTKENSGHTQQAFENDVKIMVFKLLSTEKRNPKCMD